MIEDVLCRFIGHFLKWPGISPPRVPIPIRSFSATICSQSIAHFWSHGSFAAQLATKHLG
jgi:hypothetical protein